jgi:hypothetical protein
MRAVEKKTIEKNLDLVVELEKYSLDECWTAYDQFAPGAPTTIPYICIYMQPRRLQTNHTHLNGHYGSV